jgi:hypothetical protein
VEIFSYFLKNYSHFPKRALNFPYQVDTKENLMENIINKVLVLAFTVSCVVNEKVGSLNDDFKVIDGEFSEIVASVNSFDVIDDDFRVIEGELEILNDGIKAFPKNADVYFSVLRGLLFESGRVICSICRFENCSSLAAITIPKSVTSLSVACFMNCSSLSCVTIPNSVTTFPYCCFHGCSNLITLVILDAVKSIGERCFLGCSSLTNLTIPDSVEQIENNCFEKCSSLASITIPKNVNSLGIDCLIDALVCKSIWIPLQTKIGSYTLGCALFFVDMR